MLCAKYHSIANLVVSSFKRMKVIDWGTMKNFKNIRNI